MATHFWIKAFWSGELMRKKNVACSHSWGLTLARKILMRFSQVCRSWKRAELIKRVPWFWEPNPGIRVSQSNVQVFYGWSEVVRFYCDYGGGELVFVINILCLRWLVIFLPWMCILHGLYYSQKGFRLDTFRSSLALFIPNFRKNGRKWRDSWTRVTGQWQYKPWLSLLRSHHIQNGFPTILCFLAHAWSFVLLLSFFVLVECWDRAKPGSQ